MYQYGKTSRSRLDTCDERLQRLFEKLIETQDITILCGHRGQEEQDAAYAAGKSNAQWPQSKHNTKPSQAVDAAPYPVKWEDISSFQKMAVSVKALAEQMGIQVRWGGDFTKLKDYVHWELV